MTDPFRLFDAYNRQARLYPALIALLPPFLLGLAAFPQIATNGVGALLLSAAVTSGLLFLVADVGRTRGKLMETRLLSSWGGWPTTLWLRHSTSHLPSPTKLRYHAFLNREIPDLSLPSIEEESISVTAADARYASAVHWLKEQCRGNAFRLIHKENAAYGFRRNMLGLRPLAIWIAALTLLGGVCGVVIAGRNIVASPQNILTLFAAHVPILLAIASAAIGLVCWVRFVVPGWVRQAGDCYARALLAACDSIVPSIAVAR